MLQQDSTSETGITDNTPRGNSTVARAKDRKANAALQMRIEANASWDEIAEGLGYPTPRAAMVAVERALEKEMKSEESKKHLRALASKRLDQLLGSVWTKATTPTHPEHLQAADRAHKMLDRWIKLHGLDAPQEFIVNSPSQEELERWVATVVTASVPQLEEPDIFEDDVVEGEVVE